jgi:hypothetical protein
MKNFELRIANCEFPELPSKTSDVTLTWLSNSQFEIRNSKFFSLHP